MVERVFRPFNAGSSTSAGAQDMKEPAGGRSTSGGLRRAGARSADPDLDVSAVGDVLRVLFRCRLGKQFGYLTRLFYL